MASSQMQRNGAGQANVAARVASKVKDALRSDKAFEAGSLALSARIAGAAAAAVVDLPVEARRELGKRQGELARGIRRLVKAFSDEPSVGKVELDLPEDVAPSTGEGLGEIVSGEEGERLLSDIAVTRRLEDWAGPVAGATELSRDYGVPRSTLNHWHHAGEVVALLKGTRNHVYPIAQFVDGRPARGLAAISTLAGNSRIAWFWLSRPNAALSGRKPIDVLKQDRVDEVLDVARAYFDAQ